jgi:hypothetical protein
MLKYLMIISSLASFLFANEALKAFKNKDYNTMSSFTTL